MIKFVHKKNADRARGSARIIITYSFMEIVLGFILLFTNISAMIMIYDFTNHLQNGADSSIELVNK